MKQSEIRTGAPVGRSPQVGVIDRLWTYWNSLRLDGPVPLRSAIRPLEVGTLLGSAFIAERDMYHGARFRVAGRTVETPRATDLTGLPVGSMLSTALRPDMSMRLGQVFQCPATLHATFTSSTTHARAELLLLPVADSEGVVHQALGCWVADDCDSYFDELDSIDTDVLIRRPVNKKAAPSGRPQLRIVA